jgi:hypothetical protein
VSRYIATVTFEDDIPRICTVNPEAKSMLDNGMRYAKENSRAFQRFVKTTINVFSVHSTPSLLAPAGYRMPLLGQCFFSSKRHHSLEAALSLFYRLSLCFIVERDTSSGVRVCFACLLACFLYVYLVRIVGVCMYPSQHQQQCRNAAIIQSSRLELFKEGKTL